MKKIILFAFAVFSALLLCVGCSASEGSVGGETEPSETTAPIEPSALNGIELAEFAIVYSAEDHDYSKRAAEYIKEEILARTGIELPLVEDSEESPSEYEIVVGETEREISSRLDANTLNTQFAILAEEKQIALEGDYFIIAAAAYYFVETYVPEANVNAEIPMGVSICEPIVEETKNYIFLIGDGMGFYQTRLFDVQTNRAEYGDKEKEFYGYYFPAMGFARTNSYSGTTDSAAAGTALASGFKTINGYVGQDETREEVQSLTELAISLGMSTAVMSTEASTGATPAAFSAHADHRSEAEDILADQQMMMDTYGTIICCGFDYYTAEEVALIEEKITSTLDTIDDNENGFFLMYEEAYIDKHSHEKKNKETFLAVIRFNQAIARFMEYAFYHPDTFVLITADHETGMLLPDSFEDLSYNTTSHSSYYVPVFAYGAGSELFNGRVIENVQIPHTIASFMGVDDFGDQYDFQRLTAAQ